MTDQWIIEAAGATHPGQRKHNEDSWRVDTDAGFFIVADGVGGREAGEVASRIACDVSTDQVRAGAAPGAALRAANSAIRQAIESSGAQASSMASTAVVLHLQPDAGSFAVAWAGDSRLYLWDGELKALTRDHSLVESMLQRGEISRAEADAHPRKNVILVALGDTQDELEPGENRGHLPENALFLLCSDGLSDVVAVDTLCEILSRQEDSLQMRADALVQSAVEAGGRDNITAVLVACRDGGDGSAEPAPPDGEPVVYETYDPVSGESRRNTAEDRPAPTIRRVPARGDDTGTRPVPDPLTGPARGRRTSRSAGWGWWFIAAALLVGGLVWIVFLARHGP